MLMLLVLIIMTFNLNLQYANIKEDYVNTFAPIITTIEKEDAELAAEVIQLLTHGASQQGIKEGEEILAQYGLTKNLENSLFPYINKTYTTNYTMNFLIIVSVFIILFFHNYFQYAYFYKKIRSITLGAQNIVKGNYNTIIDEGQEGDFSKLATAFNSMASIIRTQLEELKKEKNFLVELLADISHQLKTPLASLILYNDIMLENQLPREREIPFLENNQNQLNRMEWLIKNLLKLAKLDAKAIEFTMDVKSLNNTIEDVIEDTKNKAAENSTKINFDNSHEIFLKHDSNWLKEALINILINSIEHSKGEYINIQLLENPLYKRIVIEDNGEGIGKDDLPNIFKRFYKVQSNKKSDSIGIGLALAKAIIEGQDGIIEAQSQLGEGTRFIITFLKY